MKNIFTLLTAALLVSVSVSAQSLYSTQFKTVEEFEAWTVVDANNDESTWKFDDWGSPSYVFYPWNSQNAADDWLISPEIMPAKTGTVAITYAFQGSSYKESMEVFVGKTTTPADFGTPLATYTDIVNEMYNGYVLIDAQEGEAFRVAFRATTPKDRMRLYICSVEAKHIDSAMDLGVTAITSPVSAMGLSEENVTITINNYATTDVTGFSVSYKIDDNEAVVETIDGTLKAGEQMEYTFATKANLSTPRKLYNIKAFTNIADDLNNSNDTCTVSVRHQAPATAPYFLGFEADEDLAGISYHNLNGDDGVWHIEQGGGFFSLSRTGDGCLAYNYNSSNPGDDWAILEPINVEPGYYTLKFWYAATENHPEKLAVYYGNGSTPEAMTNKVLEINPMTNASYQEAIVILNFTEAQSINFGFYSFSPKNENWILIDDLSFDRVNSESIDLSVDNLSSPFDFIRLGDAPKVVFDVRNLGIKDVSAVAKLSIDGSEVATQEIEVKGQEIKTVTFDGALSNLAVGKYSLAVEVVAEGDEVATNNTFSKEIVTLGDAVKFWNFENAQVPEEFTFEVNDEGTVNPDAGSEFNEYGWGIIKVSEHPMLGSYVFAGTSWLDGTEKANRSVILPAIDITKEDSYFVWDANSIDPNFLERYSVDIQDNTSEYPYFTSKYSVAAESIYPTTQGISLADYVGKNISIAFNLTTADGNCLILDNIGIYDGLTMGIESIAQEATTAIIVTNNEVRATGAQLIVLTDMLGRTVKTTTGETLDLTNVATGIYVAVVKTATSTTSCKLVKR